MRKNRELTPEHICGKIVEESEQYCTTGVALPVRVVRRSFFVPPQGDRSIERMKSGKKTFTRGTFLLQ